MNNSLDKKIWFNSYPKEVPPSINYPDVPLYQFLIDSAKEYPDRDAVAFMGKHFTYRKLLQYTYQFANALKKLGVKKGDRVAIMLPNSPQGVIGYYGVLMLGAIVVQTNPLYTERELEHQLVDSGAETIIALDLVFPRVAKVKEKTSLKNIIVTSIKDVLPFPKNLLYPQGFDADTTSYMSRPPHQNSTQTCPQRLTLTVAAESFAWFQALAVRPAHHLVAFAPPLSCDFK